MNTFSLSHFRSQLPQIIKDVDENFEQVIITVNGEAKATVVSPQEIESYEETIQTLSNEESVQALIAAEEAWKKGNVHTHEDVFS